MDEQAGVVALRQLIESCVDERTASRWVQGSTRLARGVYYLVPRLGGAPVPLLARCWAGVLLGGPDSRIGGLAAAVLDGLADDLTIGLVPTRGRDGFESSATIHVLAPGNTHRRSHPGFVFLTDHRWRLRSLACAPSRTRIEDTVLDLCSAATTDDARIAWIARGVQGRATTAARLLERLEVRPRLRGREMVRGILRDVAAGATSNLEVLAVRTVYRPHGLGDVELQFRPSAAPRIVDGAFPGQRLIVELDGRIGHLGEGVFRDRRRDNAHVSAGWTTLRYGWRDVAGGPCLVAAEIHGVLAARGRAAAFIRCSRCPSS